MNDDLQSEIARAARAISTARALVITAGAGMGVDSGLPDFRGDRGFWRAYPAFGELGLSFVDLANPRWFAQDPALAWGFYGHRLELYRRTVPHRGFEALRAWSLARPNGAMVFTSNVDGHFQRAGFGDEHVVECHGSLAFLQCTRECGVGLFSSKDVRVDVDPSTFRARGALPACPRCGALARPNVLMFGDGEWDPQRTAAQESRLARWLEGLSSPPTPGPDLAAVVVIESGAGTAVPSVRHFGEALARRGATLVRLNVREPDVPRGHIGIAEGACAALEGIARLVT